MPPQQQMETARTTSSDEMKQRRPPQSQTDYNTMEQVEDCEEEEEAQQWNQNNNTANLDFAAADYLVPQGMSMSLEAGGMDMQHQRNIHEDYVYPMSRDSQSDQEKVKKKKNNKKAFTCEKDEGDVGGFGQSGGLPLGEYGSAKTSSKVTPSNLKKPVVTQTASVTSQQLQQMNPRSIVNLSSPVSTNHPQYKKVSIASPEKAKEGSRPGERSRADKADSYGATRGRGGFTTTTTTSRLLSKPTVTQPTKQEDRRAALSMKEQKSAVREPSNISAVDSKRNKDTVTMAAHVEKATISTKGNKGLFSAAQIGSPTPALSVNVSRDAQLYQTVAEKADVKAESKKSDKQHTPIKQKELYEEKKAELLKLAEHEEEDGLQQPESDDFDDQCCQAQPSAVDSEQERARRYSESAAGGCPPNFKRDEQANGGQQSQAESSVKKLSTSEVTHEMKESSEKAIMQDDPISLKQLNIDPDMGSPLAINEDHDDEGQQESVSVNSGEEAEDVNDYEASDTETPKLTVVSLPVIIWGPRNLQKLATRQKLLNKYRAARRDLWIFLFIGLLFAGANSSQQTNTNKDSVPTVTATK